MTPSIRDKFDKKLLPGHRQQLRAVLTELDAEHWYPKKFILTPEQHKGYVDSRRADIGGAAADVTEHMGVPVEVAEGTPGVMVAVDGAKVSLH
jgi:hypothetical protein